MKLRWKTLLIVGITFVVVLAISLAVMQASTLDSVLRIEHDDTLQETEVVTDALSRELSDLSASAKDYAAWNDTYEFVQTGTPDYVAENMIAETFANLRWNIALFLNSSDQVVYGKAFDLQNMTVLPFPADLVQHVNGNDLLLHHGNATGTKTGLILLPRGPVLIASSPVVTSLHQGPIQGTLITGRFLDSHEINELCAQTHMPIAFQILGSSWISSDFETASSLLSEEQPLFSQPLDSENVAGYALVNDIYGNSVLMLRITMPRDYYAQGLTSMVYGTVALFSVGATMCVVLMVLLERFVLSRLSHLRTDVRVVGQSGNLAARIPTRGKDELSELESDINSMLSKLEQTTKRFGALLETAREGIVAVDPNENITFANRAFADIVGYDQAELTGMNVLKMLNEEGVRKVAQETDLRKKGETSRYELTFLRKDGGARTAQLSASPLWSEDGSFAGSLSIIMDVTEQKRLECDLAESNTRLQQVTDNMSDMVTLADATGVCEYVSPSIRKTLGYDPNDLVGKALSDFIHPDDAPRVMEEIQKALQAKTTAKTEYRYRHTDGHYLWMESRGNSILDDKEEMTGLVVSSHDITERKTMEEALQKSEERFRGIAERSFDAIATVDLEGTITYASPSVANVLGFPQAETVGKSFLEYFQPVQLSNATQLFSDLLQGKKIEGLQLDLLKKDGTRGTVEINASPITAKGEVTGIQAVFRDITQRKQTEEALRESLERFRQVAENAQEWIWEVDPDGMYTYASPAIERILGYKPVEIIGKKRFYDLFAPEEREKCKKEALEGFARKEAFHGYINANLDKHGRLVWVSTSGMPILDREGNLRGYRGADVDITESRRMGEALRESEEKYRNLVELAPDGIVAVDAEGIITMANHSFLVLTGYASGEEVIGKRFTELKSNRAEDIPKLLETFESLAKGEVPSQLEFLYVRKDGTSRWADVRPSLLTKDGQFVGALVIMRDVTERKNAEKLIQENQQKFEQLFMSNPEAAVYVDTNERVLNANPRFTELFGYSHDEIKEKFLDDLIVSEDRKEEALMLAQKGKEGYVYHETVRKNKKGSLIPVSMSSAPIVFEGQRLGDVVLYGDITERKRAEEALRESEERLRRLIELAPIAIYTNDLEGKFVGANKQAEELTGYKLEELVGRNLLEVGLISDEDLPKAMDGVQKNLRGEMSGPDEYRIIRKDGTTAILEQSSFPVARAGKVEIIGIARDITQRKMMEDALRESEEKVRNIFRSSPDAIVVTELDGTIVDCNDATLSLAGISKKEELLGKNSYELLSKDSYEKAMKAMERIFELRTVRNLEYNLIAKDGHEFPAEVSISLMLDASGAPKYIVATIEDITERKKMQKALRELEEKTRSIIQSSPNAITVGDLNGTILDCNQADIDMFGYSTKEEMIGKNGFDFIATKDQERAAEVSKKIFDTGIVKNFQCNGVAKDGHEFPVEISTSLVRDASGEPLYLVGIIEDITERKRMENLLRQSEERFRGIAERSFDIIVTVNVEGHITYVSPAVTLMLGYSPEELMRKPFHEFVTDSGAAKTFEAFARVVEGEVLKDFQVEVLRKDGSKAAVELNASPILQNKEMVGIQAIVRDVTERQQMLRKLEEYSQQLEQMVDKRTRQLKEAQGQLVKSERLAAIGEVAAMVGHDLRNPLTGIKGAAYYLKTKPNLKMDQKSLEMLELIEHDVEYSNKIITDLMDYSREIKLEPTETDPSSIMKEALSLVQIPNNVQIADNTQNQPKTKLDMEKIKRVFSNLVKNAVDAMPNGGKLSISSKHIDGSVEFSFVDTGTGMAKEVIEKIYTPFFTTKAKGMGLGLAICKRIIETHGGRISVESIVGEGTTFTITIPTEPPQKQAEGGEQVWMNVPESLLSTTTKA